MYSKKYVKRQDRVWYDKRHIDRKIHGEKFNTGDFVWLWNPAVPRKEGYNCKKVAQSVARTFCSYQAAVRRHLQDPAHSKEKTTSSSSL